ncbi:MAG: cyoD [Candidatus Saccharibacteria bacterium]|nr:cyoD [Candidatus Saccharibacteria bacterium]
MSQEHPEDSRPKREPGTLESYIIGFCLSLLLTALPYRLVVTKAVTGNTLLATILGFAALQMLVQIFFFLHLGRGPKPLYNVVFFGSTVGLIAVVVGGSIFIMNHLHYNMTPTEASNQLAQDEGIYQVEGTNTGACQKLNAKHQVTISSGKISPIDTKAQLCDTLTFMNEDSAAHDIAFGTYPNQDTYDGQTKLMLRKGGGMTITLDRSGTYQFYEHDNPKIAGSFTVSP